MANPTLPPPPSREVIEHAFAQHEDVCGCGDGTARHAWCSCRNAAALVCSNGVPMMVFARPKTWCRHAEAARVTGCLRGWVEVDEATAWRWARKGGAA